jgi:hypothetical protein
MIKNICINSNCNNKSQKILSNGKVVNQLFCKSCVNLPYLIKIKILIDNEKMYNSLKKEKRIKIRKT